MKYLQRCFVAFLASFALCLPVTVFAVDGVILIDQNKASAGNVTPGDLPGFPVTISQPGSYRLSSNLTVPDEQTTAIEIRIDDVTIDLNGFAIRGPGRPAPSVPGRPGRGIANVYQPGDGTTFFGFSYAAILNGTISGMGNDALDLGHSSQVTNMRVHNNAGYGIYVGADSVVSGNIVRFNQNGVTAETGTIVRGNAVHGISAGGTLFAFCGTSVVNNTAGAIVQGSVAPDCVTRADNYPAP